MFLPMKYYVHVPLANRKPHKHPIVNSYLDFIVFQKIWKSWWMT